MANDVGQIQLTISVDDRGTVAAIDRTKKLETNIKKLANARARQAITEKEYRKGLTRINKQMRTSNMSYQKATPIIHKYAKAQLNAAKTSDLLSNSTGTLNRNVGNTKNKMNGSNMAIQQLGYQFGDFAVQVQGGTSAFVAFSQQGSQLAGILPMIAGPLGLSMGAAVGLSAALGILIPIGSAVGRMFMESGTQATTLKEAMEDVGNSVDEINSAVDKLNELNSNGNLTSASLAMISISESSKAIAEAQFDASIISFIDKLDVANSKFTTVLETAKQLGLLMINPFMDMEDLSDENIYSKAFDKLGLSVNKKIFEGARDGLEQALVGGSLEEQLNALQAFRNVLAPTVAVPSSGDGEEGRITKRLPTSKAGESMLQSTEAMIKLIESQVARQQAIIDKQLKDEEKERVRLHNVRFANEEALMSMSLSMSKENIGLIKDNQDAEIRRHNQRFADEESVMGMTLSLSKENIELTKKNQEADIRRHNQRFADEESLMAQAVTMTDETIALVEKVSKARTKAYNQRFAEETFLYKQRFSDEDALMSMSLTPAKQDFSVYEKQEQAQKDFLATLRLSTQEQLVIAGLNDRELLVAEQFNETYRTKLELDKLGIEYGSARYERALETLKTQQESILYVYDMVEAEKKLTEEKEKQGQLIDTIGGIIGDGFISMVEGTESVKDAFKSMARAIIKELYEILVVQQMVNAAKAAFGIPVPNANGNVFSSGSIQAYADGGVVGSPTTFPMSGGRTGLMGEAGPEAIMPLKRGANGKLGVQMEGGATTTVVQNFSFSANGDDSVKRIIAQAAPKIAQMTKSEIINDRRRGGTMKATFG